MTQGHSGQLSSATIKQSPPARLKQLVWLFAIVIIIALGLVVAIVLNSTYRTSLDGAIQGTEIKSNLLEQRTELVIGDMDSLLLAMSARVLNDPVTGETLQDFLIRIATTVPSIRVLVVVDAAGIALADSRTGDTAVGVDVSDRPYYRVHLEQPDRGLFIGPPVQSRFDGNWSMPISRAVRNADGEMKAVVVASISPLFFSELLAPLAEYPSESGSLILEDSGIALATFPHNDSLVGQSIVGSPLWTDYQTQKRTGGQTTVANSQIIRSYLPVGSWPLFVSYQIDRSDALAPFRRSAFTSIIISLFFVGLVVAIAFFQTKQVQTLADRTDALQRANSRLEQEIAQRIEAEQAIRLYKQAVEASGDMILVVDADYVYRMVNSTYLHYHQRQQHEILDRTMDDIIDDELVRMQLKSQIDRCMTGESTGAEIKYVYPTLGERYLASKTFPLRNDQGQIVGAVLTLRDITEQKSLERQYWRAQKMESIGRLAGGIAHDFNNLLVPIIGYVELGINSLSPDDKLRADLKIVQRAAERGAELTRQILAFSRRQILSMQVTDLNEVITSFKNMMQRFIGEDIELQIFLYPSLDFVNADKGQIEQVLMNLVLNARDAMPNEGKLTIETANAYLDEAYIAKYADVQAPGHYVMLSISDSGHGMDSETKEKIFEPFFTTKEQGKGTGLGLATVFGIVKQHKGNIWVYSEVEKGTTFKIYLPREEQPAEPIPAPAHPIDYLHGTETILVVEDEEMVRTLICETCQAHGYSVIEAASPTEALQFSANYRNTIDLLLTDVVLPGMNGRQLYEKLAATRPNIKTLYISGYTDNVIVHHGILDDKVNFLQKPFSVERLLKTIRNVFTSTDRSLPVS